MRTVAPVTEQFQHFVADLKESFWGDVYGKVRGKLEKFLAKESERLRNQYLGWAWHERTQEAKQDDGNGFYWRSFVTRVGTLRIKVARTRKRGFLPEAIQAFERRTADVALLIREAFLQGIATRQVGRVVARVTGGVLSAHERLAFVPELG
jgi:transposase-like protein